MARGNQAMVADRWFRRRWSTFGEREVWAGGINRRVRGPAGAHGDAGQPHAWRLHRLRCVRRLRSRSLPAVAPCTRVASLPWGDGSQADPSPACHPHLTATSANRAAAAAPPTRPPPAGCRARSLSAVVLRARVGRGVVRCARQQVGGQSQEDSRLCRSSRCSVKLRN